MLLLAMVVLGGALAFFADAFIDMIVFFLRMNHYSPLPSLEQQAKMAFWLRVVLSICFVYMFAYAEAITK